MNSIVLNILNTCIELKEYGVDAFFEYMPHVQSINIRLYINGWKNSESKEREEATYLKSYLEKDFIPDGYFSIKELEEELLRILSEVKNENIR